jgi:hypothetical protein
VTWRRLDQRRCQATEDGASRTRTGDLLGAMVRRAPRLVRASAGRSDLTGALRTREVLRLLGFRRNGAKGTRTPDLLGAIQALSQLSYSPVYTRTRAALGEQPV